MMMMQEIWTSGVRVTTATLGSYIIVCDFGDRNSIRIEGQLVREAKRDGQTRSSKAILQKRNHKRARERETHMMPF
jgi:predicted Rdx family selenoprotein